MPASATNFVPMTAEVESETTEDAVLGGRLILRQPRRGHRVGHDAILLAAATEARAGEHVVELGAGVGAAGLALAQRVPGVRVTLVEIDSALAALARDNAARNGFADRVQVAVLDVAASEREFAAAGIAPGAADPLRQAVRGSRVREAALRVGRRILPRWIVERRIHQDMRRRASFDPGCGEFALRCRNIQHRYSHAVR